MAELEYEVVGASGAPVIALHGLGGDRSQLRFIAVAGATIYRPDLRAHGVTRLDESGEFLTIEQLARDVADTFADLDRPILIGSSMGAAIALDLVARGFPARALGLVRPAWHWTPSPPNLAGYPFVADLLDRLGPGPAARAALTASRYHADIARVSPAAAAALVGLLAAPDAAARAPRLRAIPASAPARPDRVPPTLVIGGPADPVHPLDLARGLADELDATMHCVPARYDHPNDHRASVTATLADFVGRA